LTPEERKRLLEALVDEVGRRIRVVAQTGCLDTGTTIELTRHAMAVGAAAAGVIAPPFYHYYDHRALIRHYKAVANAVKGFPVFLYNIPSYSGNTLTPALVLELAGAVDNVVGLKDSGFDMVALDRIIADAPAGFCVLNGIDPYTFQALVTGAAGSVAVSANAFPELFVSLFDAVKKGDLKTARAKQVLVGRAWDIFRHGPLVAVVKETLRLRGGDPGCVRPPQRELTVGEKKALARALEAAGLI
jgi:dihydrodipicolinate synthase/N-acetylneuraminate lyase